ncbi:Aldo/keto reductase family protein [Bradyrhizobium arachidis]|nr:Aldo/keto reductase family protein [Bradyrhizobium arachidis]
MIAQETFTLGNGVRIPKVVCGTWMIDDGDVAGLVQQAIAIGYRHIDTAQAYANERGVGEGLRASGIARDELFVTTKLDLQLQVALPTMLSEWMLAAVGPAVKDRPFFPALQRVLARNQRSSRIPLKKGCRTLPSADLARYSISASNFGSTQMPLCAIRFA